MNAVADDSCVLDDMRRKLHARRRSDAFALIRASGHRHEVRNFGLCLTFREPGKPAVDFFPTTGRWRVVGQPAAVTMNGGAPAFLTWYEGASA